MKWFDTISYVKNRLYGARSPQNNYKDRKIKIILISRYFKGLHCSDSVFIQYKDMKIE